MKIIGNKDAIDKLGIQVIDWKKRSESGEVCGILGCEGMPTVSCPHCGNWYCDEHKGVHFHIV